MLLANFTWSVYFTLHCLSRPNLGYIVHTIIFFLRWWLGLGQVRPISAIIHGLSWFSMVGISFYGAVPICPQVACALNYIQGANFHMTRLFLGNYGILLFFTSTFDFLSSSWISSKSQKPWNLILTSFYDHIFLKMKMKKQIIYVASMVGLLCKKEEEEK